MDVKKCKRPKTPRTPKSPRSSRTPKTPRTPRTPRKKVYKQNGLIQVSSSTHKAIKVILPPKKPKDTIVIICTDMSDRLRASHIIDASKALNIYGYEVILVTCRNPEKTIKSLKKIKVLKVGSWIPGSFLGYFKNLFYGIRSAYIAFWVVRYSPQKPIMVFCESSKIVLPILNWGELKVAYFQYVYGLLNNGRTSKQANIESNWLARLCLPFANAVLVPSRQYREIYRTTFKDLHFNPIVMYPYIHTKKLDKTKSQDLYKKQLIPGECYNPTKTIYLVLGEYLERSNFELAVKSFEYLMKIVNPCAKSQLYLIIAGCNSSFTKRNVGYYEKIKRMIKMSRCNKHFVLIKKVSSAERKSLINLSCVIVHTPTDELFNKIILEVMYMAKPVIASESGYTKEIIQNEITGFIVEQGCCPFAKAMNYFVNKPRITRMMGHLAQLEFLRRYSLMSFGARLRRLIINNCSYGIVPTVPKHIFTNYLIQNKIPNLEKLTKKLSRVKKVNFPQNANLIAQKA